MSRSNPPFNDSDTAAHCMTEFGVAKGSKLSNQSGEGDIRRALIVADLVDFVALTLL